MAVRRFRYGSLRVTVADAGEGVPPWRHEHGAEPVVYEYKVTVRAPNGATYEGPAWGSRHDYGQGKRQYRDLAQMMVNDLASAVTDPDEWFTIVIGDAKGREAYERGKTAESVLEAARAMGEDGVIEAGDAARLEEERGTSPKEWTPGEGEEED
jgi:hypothetical protein